LSALAGRVAKATATLFTALLTACASGPIVPEWQIDSKAAMDRATAAYLEGDSRVEQAEWARVRRILSATGRPDLLADAELRHCAARVASLANLDGQPCAGFETLRADATETQMAYAAYLAGHATPTMLALLPAAQRTVAAATTPDAQAAALRAVADPLSQLVAAGVLLQTGKASPTTLELAAATASAQGWRRPLLAWLGVQALRAEQAGLAAEAARLHRRMALVDGNSTKKP